MVAALAAVAGCNRGGPPGADEKKPPVLSIPRNQMTHDGPVSSVAFGPDGKMLASGSQDDTIRLWDVATGKERAILKGHENRVTSVAYSPDSKTMASVSVDKTIRLWDVPATKQSDK